VRERVLAAVRRIIRGEAIASGAERDPEITVTDSFPVLSNDPAASERTAAAFRATFGDALVIDPGPVSASEDFGDLRHRVRCARLLLGVGGVDGAAYLAAAQAGTVDRDVPSNHSPFFRAAGRADDRHRCLRVGLRRADLARPGLIGNLVRVVLSARRCR